MSWVKKDEPKYRLVWALAVISLASCALWFGTGTNSTSASVKSKTSAPANVAPSAVFPANAGTLGAIPDNAPLTPRNVTFTVSGITGAPTNVEVSHTYGGTIHSWVGDLDVTLIGPGGSPSHVIYGRTGQTGTNAGDSSDLSGPYVFKDSAAGTNWWAEAFARGGTEVLTPGDYRTTAAGPQPVNNSSPVTNLTAAFAGVANPNGTWTLRFADNAGGDTGAVSAASLTITGAATPTTGRWLDRDGDGKADYVVARATNSPLGDESAVAGTPVGSYRERVQKAMLDTGDNLGATSIYWYTNRSSNNTNTVDKWGLAATDFITPNDYDGDLKSDIAVWRTGGAGSAAFYIFRTSDNTVKIDVFGQTNDDPGVTGDYDGDGKADVAVYRCPPTTGQCTFFYRASGAGMGAGITYAPWGFGTLSTLFASPGDFDGDGKHDFCIQRTHPTLPGKGEFVLRKSGGGDEYIQWGNNTDVIAPGDYDGDGKADFTVVRNQSGQFVWYTLFRSGGSVQAPFGVTNDFLTPADYDGDGKTDRSVWRPSATAGQSRFYHLNSNNLSVGQFQYGQNGDYPPANSQVH